METNKKTNSESANAGKNGFKKMNVLVNALPGNISELIAREVLKQEDMYLIRSSLTGEGVISDLGGSYGLDNIFIHLDEPMAHEGALEALNIQYQDQGGFITVDFAAPRVKGQPSPAKGNAKLYCSLMNPFVMGATTTTDDISEIKKMVVDSGNIAVYAPNFAAHVVIFQDMLQYAANKYPGALNGYLSKLIESHQASKKDTSGTMRAVIKDLQKLGVEANEDQIVMIRDPGSQENFLGVQKQFLGGHAYHTYNIISPDQTARLSFSHLVDGRSPYLPGILASVRFLNRMKQEGAVGKVYSYIDVLSEGGQ